MPYYEVLVGSLSYHGDDALTYYADQELVAGSVIQVPLRQAAVLGIVIRTVTKPSFSAKPILNAFDLPPLPPASLQLLKWLHSYYPAPLGLSVQLFLPKSLSKKLIESVPDLPLSSEVNTAFPQLTTEQINVLQRLTEPGTYLLHGETGSGKTRVYTELAQQVLSTGKSALLLTPEIGLTAQLVRTLRQHLPYPVIVYHSQLTVAERRTIWLQVLMAKTPLVIVGARSSLFLPFTALGLLVIDEAHDSAYKQEQSPHYATQPLASQLRAYHQALLVMGSATPSIVDYHTAEQKQVPVLRMKSLAKNSGYEQPAVVVVDLKERHFFTESSLLSDQLVTAIRQALVRQEQSLIFLNRRGTARVIICHACGWQALCPNCDIPLTYHADSHNLRCHICGVRTPAPVSCPECASADIVFKSVGTKAVASEVERLFPGARVRRFDNDNLKGERFALSYDQVKTGKVDIIVGTQTLSKGLDLPLLSVVGVVVAETSLYLPDYTANERTYQLLYQVLGRIGRGHRAGVAVVQTYEPANPLINAAIARDWNTFYSHELQERKQYRFPPFCFLLKLTCKKRQSTRAEAAAENLVQQLAAMKLPIQIIGPSPAFHEKVANYYQWQIVIKSSHRSALVKVITALPSGWSYDLDPIDLL